MDYISFLTKLGMRPKKTSNEEWCGSCPFDGCDADDDGFIYNVSDDYYYCRRCRRSGTLSWLKREMGEESDFVYQKKPKQEIPKPIFKNHIDPDIFKRTSNEYVNRVAYYYSSFGISIDVINKYQVGWYENGLASGYFIPQFIELREAGRYLMGAEIRVANLQSKMKFYSVDGSVRGGFHQTQYVSIPGYIQGPKMPYLFVCEAAKDAMVLNTMGFNASAYRPEHYWNNSLSYCLQNVETVIWMQDNDWRWDNGLQKQTSAGKDLADRFTKFAKREIFRMATPNHKQPSDMAAAVGINQVKEWILEEKAWLSDYVQ